MNPLVSIMIATYNQPGYIVQAVLSCLNQDYENMEVVVGDDSINDDVYNALLPFLKNEKLKYFRNEKNLGRVKNYKKLLFDYALGDWAIMLDGDDYYIDNHFISKAMKWITENDKVVLVSAGHLVIDENKSCESTEVLTAVDKCFDGKEIFYNKIMIGQHSTNLYNRKLAKELDFYRLESMASDAEGLFRLCLHGDVVYLSNIVVIWRLHTHNNTFKAKEAIKQMHEMIFIDNIYQYALKFIDAAAAKSWRKSFYTSMSYHIISLAENSGSYLNILRVSYWVSEFWGIPATFRYLKTQTYKYFFKN
jgi:glycosyltransferase involved in cell wall biosynthesis